jgi:hypothetical protein
MTRYLPIAFGVLLMVGLTILQVGMTDRLSDSNITAAQRADLLNNIPMDVGDWHATNIEVDERVRHTAGAVGAVQRKYRNSRTGEEVDLWLIVGHGRSVARHTPDVCYRSSGFKAHSVENSHYPMTQEDGTEVPFLTNKFFREDTTGRRLIRVFWTWYDAGNEKQPGKIVWEVDSNPTWYFGNTRALFKMYFTSVMRDTSETAEKSACLNFAREFMPVVNNALAQVANPDAKPAPKAEDSETTNAEPAAETEAQPTAKANAEAPAATAEAPAESPSPSSEAEAAVVDEGQVTK